jgi:ferredoxin-thioredoxin reductase catalytic subunit
MDDIVYNPINNIMTCSPDKLEAELKEIAYSFGYNLPERIQFWLKQIANIKSFETVERFYTQAPAELQLVSMLTELSFLIDGWNNLIKSKEMLLKTAKLLQEEILPPGNIKLMFISKTLKDLAKESLFILPHRITEYLYRYEMLLDNYTTEYLAFHEKHNSELMKIQRDLDELKEKQDIVLTFSKIKPMQPFCPDALSNEINAYLTEWCPCEHKLSRDEIIENFICPECERTFVHTRVLSVFHEKKAQCDELFKKCMSALSRELSRVVLEKENDPIKSIISSLAVADLSSIRNVMSPELVNRIKSLLEKS